MTWTADLAELAGKATPGPWEASHRDVGNPENDPDKECGCMLGWEINGPPKAWHRGQFERGHDAVFIAACSPERIRALCDVAEAARSLIEGGDQEPAWVALADALARLDPKETP